MFRFNIDWDDIIFRVVGILLGIAFAILILIGGTLLFKMWH